MVTCANHPLPTYYALSTDTDTIPTAGVPNGAKLVEMDTGKEYYFNETGGAWVEWTQSAGT